MKALFSDSLEGSNIAYIRAYVEGETLPHPISHLQACNKYEKK
jgi:hypothetical protein